MTEHFTAKVAAIATTISVDFSFGKTQLALVCFLVADTYTRSEATAFVGALEPKIFGEDHFRFGAGASP